MTVLFTFDYELFLGDRSGKAWECLLEPTDLLLELLARFGFKASFFIDTVYLLRLEEIAATHEAAARDLNAIHAQLANIALQGHNIFPHIHGHWLDAIYVPDQNEWSLRHTRYYQFSSLDESQQEQLFEHSIHLLRGVLRHAGVDQPIDSYRAGGWSIQPFKDFEPFFRQYDIRQDWSVMPGKYHFSQAHSFDFRQAPADRPVYRFEKDPAIRDDNGRYTEWTISALHFSPREKWINFKVGGLLQRLGKLPERKGATVSAAIREEGDSLARHGSRVIASFEGLNPYTLRKYRKALNKTDYFQFISHPKLLTPYEFRIIEKLFQFISGKSNLETDFRRLSLPG